jgi:hypothetical protein
MVSNAQLDIRIINAIKKQGYRIIRELGSSSGERKKQKTVFADGQQAREYPELCMRLKS